MLRGRIPMASGSFFQKEGEVVRIGVPWQQGVLRCALRTRKEVLPQH